jgi:NAD(P) transhydrogenase subunit alpha
VSITIGVPRETAAGETRVAVVPSVAEKYVALGVGIVVERGAGLASHYADEEFAQVGAGDSGSPAAAVTLGDADASLAADLVLTVQPPSAADVARMREGAVLVGLLDPYRAVDVVRALAEHKVTSFALELLPRITRAQSMDALTSQASVAGYKAALMAASLSGRYFPMLTTPAGTIRPSKVLVLGVGVAGLQAIATARRLGAMVEAYDVRQATKEQVHSLGGRFIDTGIDAEAEGGYARELTEDEKAKAAAIVADHVAAADAVITTAAVPGRPAPRLIDAATVARMKPGAVIVDLAAETGGNCALSQPGEQVVTDNGVIVHGPVNVPAMLPVHASDQYARNVFNFISPFIKDGELTLDLEDEVLAGSVLTRDGVIVDKTAMAGVMAAAQAAPPSGGAEGSAS